MQAELSHPLTGVTKPAYIPSEIVAWCGMPPGRGCGNWRSCFGLEAELVGGWMTGGSLPVCLLAGKAMDAAIPSSLSLSIKTWHVGTQLCTQFSMHFSTASEIMAQGGMTMADGPV